MSTFLTVIIAFFSAFAGAASKLGLESWTRIAEARSLAAILRAEILATLSIIDQRNYKAVMMWQLSELNEGREVKFWNFILNEDRLDEGYKASVTSSKLGTIGFKEAASIVKFYRQLHGIMGDVKRFGDPTFITNADERKHFLMDTIRIWGDAEKDAKLACDALLAYCEKPTWRHFLA